MIVIMTAKKEGCNGLAIPVLRDGMMDSLLLSCPEGPGPGGWPECNPNALGWQIHCIPTLLLSFSLFPIYV